jgi:hypothetical protein
VLLPWNGVPSQFNRWGMRDRDYEQEPAPGTYRIALVGASFAAGEGVAEHETFENVLEDRLNREAPQARGPRVEILNFAVRAHTPAQFLFRFEHKALAFRPQALFFVTNPSHLQDAVHHLAQVAVRGIPIPYERLAVLARAAGAGKDVPEEIVRRRLAPNRDKVLFCIYREVVELCRRHGVSPYWILLPEPELEVSEEQRAIMRPLAEAAGFTTVDLSHLYDGQDPWSLQIAPWDWHPNARGHQAIAEALHQALAANGLPPTIGAPVPRSPASPTRGRE